MKTFLIYISLFLSVPPVCWGTENFLKAPLFPNHQILEQTDSRLVLKTQMSFQEVVAFYKKSLSDTKDIKFRDWSHSLYIEDDGNLPWHSITITKPTQPSKDVIITIKKDSWTWILSTLLLRYVGVFVVLIVILICLSISGKLLAKRFKAQQ